MQTQLEEIDIARLRPELPSELDNGALRILANADIPEEADFSSVTPAIGVATILHKWCPEALIAFLDTESWLSITWNFTIRRGSDNETKFEIGRIRSQITFGRLNLDGLWDLMITYDISDNTGVWIANSDETMVGEGNIKDPAEIDTLANAFMHELLRLKPWTAGPKTKHQFFVEAMGAPMDVFGDGLAIDPRWLYGGLDLSTCTACGNAGQLSRCGRCGTAAYCSSTCQRDDWFIHKATCTMSAVDRGKALHLSRNGGLINCDWSTAFQETEENADAAED